MNFCVAAHDVICLYFYFIFFFFVIGFQLKIMKEKNNKIVDEVGNKIV